MKIQVLLAGFILHAVLFFREMAAQPTLPDTNTLEFINGQWFDGKNFTRKTMYVKGGLFQNSKPPGKTTVVDLGNQFIVPPFSEAHTHHLEGIGSPDQIINDYLKDGVYYVKNPNNVYYFTKNILDRLNKPASIDVSLANGGITASEGHPMILFEDQIRPGIESITGKTQRGWFEGKAYYTVNSAKELDDKWPLILADKPDFIKTYLANSEDYGLPSPSTKYTLRSGLNPSLLPLIVQKAHNSDLRVGTHVETAADFRAAIHAGVDELMHMPGFYLYDSSVSARYLLTDADAKLALAHKVYVVTTLMTRSLVEDKNLLPLVQANQKKNLALLKKYGVRLAIGSDHSDSPVDEVAAIRALGIFSNLELLKLWCENSAQYIFPNRKIGMLKPGYEASFLVLKNNPLHDWNATGQISARYKQGLLLQID